MIGEVGRKEEKMDSQGKYARALHFIRRIPTVNIRVIKIENYQLIKCRRRFFYSYFPSAKCEHLLEKLVLQIVICTV